MASFCAVALREGCVRPTVCSELCSEAYGGGEGRRWAEIRLRKLHGVDAARECASVNGFPPVRRNPLAPQQPDLLPAKISIFLEICLKARACLPIP
jgi:hypothetical protein